MYADTPPTLVAVAPSLLQDARGFAAVAWRIEAELRRRPVWVLLPPSPRLRRADPDAARELADDPAWDPPTGMDMSAAVLAHRLLGCHVHLPVALASDLDRVPRISAIQRGPWDGKDPQVLAALADQLSTKEILVLAPGRPRVALAGAYRATVVDPREAALELV